MLLMTFRIALVAASVAVAACDAQGRADDDLVDDDTTCDDGDCAGDCTPDETRYCYTGAPITEGVGACRGGTQTCDVDGTWGVCAGEVVPQPEICGDGVDANCTGDDDLFTDADGDGYTTCGGDCCDNTDQCTIPELANPGAHEDPSNAFDDDCDGVTDEAQLCDSGLASDSDVAADYARAMDICDTTTADGPASGLISASFSRLGADEPNPDARSIRTSFGTNVTPRAGFSFVELASGAAAATGDVNPDHQSFVGAAMLSSAPFPADFIAAHGGVLPNAPGCPDPLGDTALDAIMLTLELRVPSNANSFSLKTNFFTAEYPEYVCSPYNDYFLVLLDSAYSGDPANPADKNLATYTTPGGDQVPVGVNLAFGDTGLCTQCQNGPTGCTGNAIAGVQSTCESVDHLAGTGMDTTWPAACTNDSLMGGGTGWLTTSGNVVPGEIITLRIAIWDTSDAGLDSLVVLDDFRWSIESTEPGTDIDID